MAEKRVQVMIHGRVQGVAFRAACQREASARGLTGWVRNRGDGSVEALFEGAVGAVDAMVAWCRHGPPAAEVTEVEVHEAPEALPQRSFRIRL